MKTSLEDGTFYSSLSMKWKAIKKLDIMVEFFFSWHADHIKPIDHKDETIISTGLEKRHDIPSEILYSLNIPSQT